VVASVHQALRPLVGITAYVEPARWGVWDMRAVLLPESYVRVVHAAGGRAVLVPPLDDGGGDLIIRPSTTRAGSP